MIAFAPERSSLEVSQQSAPQFEALAPAISRIAAHAFRRLPRWRRAELMADVLALSYVAYGRLVERGKEDLIYASPLALFAVKQTWYGRQVGVRQNANDVMSPYCQRRRGVSVKSLDCRDERGGWEELVAEDKRSTPAEVAAFRLDLHDWLGRLNRRRRALALRLAKGESAQDAARHFGVSEARISQCRKELRRSWEDFQGEPAAAA